MISDRYEEFDDINQLLKKRSITYKPVPAFRHTAAADDLAFDKLWEERQEIAEIVRRSIREGKNDNGHGYKKIRAILERVS